LAQLFPFAYWLKKNYKMHRSYFININGFLFIIFGVVAILFPGITLAALGVYFAFTVIIGGIAQIVGAVRVKSYNERWYLLLPEGIIGLLLGVLILSRPELIATVFVAIIGIWALIIGAVLMFSFFRNKNAGFTNTIMLLVGVLSVITGGIIVFNPFESTRMITVLIGIYALIYGLFSVINSSKFYKK
jgi:uncharacterized membrane protein HdeD (DUF308 family)